MFGILILDTDIHILLGMYKELFLILLILKSDLIKTIALLAGI